MNADTITEIRSLICRSMSDIGGACERLRELEDEGLAPAVISDARQEIATWLSQAADALGEAALMAEAGEVGG